MRLYNKSENIEKILETYNSESFNSIIKAVLSEKKSSIKTDETLLSLENDMHMYIYSYIVGNINSGIPLSVLSQTNIINNYKKFLISLLNQEPLRVFSNRVFTLDNRTLSSIFGIPFMQFINGIKRTESNKATAINNKIAKSMSIQTSEISYIADYFQNNYDNSSLELLTKYNKIFLKLLETGKIEANVPVLKFICMYALKTSDIYKKTFPLMSKDEKVSLLFSDIKNDAIGYHKNGTILLNKDIVRDFKYADNDFMRQSSIGNLLEHTFVNSNTNASGTSKFYGINRLLQVLFHELTHVYQLYTVSNEEITDESIRTGLSFINRRGFPYDYDDNYYQQSTEVAAEAESYKELLKWLNKNKKNTVSFNVFIDNAIKVYESSIGFAKKKIDVNSSKTRYGGHFDIDMLISIASTNPEELDIYPPIINFLNSNLDGLNLRNILFTKLDRCPLFIRDCITHPSVLNKLENDSESLLKNSNNRQRFNYYLNIKNTVLINLRYIDSISNSKGIKQALNNKASVRGTINERIKEFLNECFLLIQILLSAHSYLTNSNINNGNREGEILFLNKMIKEVYNEYNVRKKMFIQKKYSFDNYGNSERKM